MTSDDTDPPDDLWSRLQGLGADGPEPSAPPPSNAPPPGRYRVGAPAGQPKPAATPEGRPAAPPAPSTALPTGSPPAPAGAPAGPATDAPSARRAAPPARRRRLRPRLRWLTLYLPALVLVLIIAAVGFGWNTFRSMGRVDLGDALQGPAGDAQNILIVGSDSRESVDADTPNAAAMGSEGVAGERSDTIIVLRLDGDRATMMSIPRDLWVTNVATGREGRVNAAYNDGPANLVRTVTANLGIPVHRYLEVDFVSFAGMVDALGGVDIEFPHTAFDRSSGLLVDQGTQRLDGTQALAYVRSRHYTELIDGREVVEPTGDLGRQQRQQTFIRTVLAEAGGTRNPLTLFRVGRAAAAGARVDREWGFFDAIGVARKLAGADPETLVLPTVGARRGSASVLLLVEDQAAPVLAAFGAE